VLDNGPEIDLELSQYKRFTDVAPTRDCFCRTGKVELPAIQKKREARFYEGKTIEVIPHDPDVRPWPI
jgi:CTP synthase